jgi:drug/metabolite transporter (DMT)-like permease
MMPLSDNLRGALYMNVAMAAFTLNDAGMKAVTQSLPLFEAITLRGAITSGLLICLGLVTGGLRHRLSRRDTGITAIRTLAEVGATLLFLTALMHMPLANLSAIMQALPLAVTLGAALVFGDRIGWRRMLAILAGFCGVLIIIRPGMAGFDVWSVAGLGSVACVVLRDLATRRLSFQVPTVLVALWSGLGVMAMGLSGVLFTGWQPVGLTEAVVVAAASCALIAGYMFGVMAMRVGDIGFVAPFRYTSLIWAIALGWLVFQALPDAMTLTGAGIVIATGIYTLYREQKLALARAASG